MFHAMLAAVLHFMPLASLGGFFLYLSQNPEAEPGLRGLRY